MWAMLRIIHAESSVKNLNENCKGFFVIKEISGTVLNVLDGKNAPVKILSQSGNVFHK
jgi:hypothetical protein